MSDHWKIETKCEENKKVVFECDKDGNIKITEQERDVDVTEINDLYQMVRMMNGSKYIHMECSKLP